MKFFESFFNKERCASTVVVTMGITATIIFLLYIHLGLAPFGLASLAVSDARIQYLDFFSFYKRVLSGNESVIYSFSKGLGSSTWAVAAYYLFSPFNFLAVFFEQQDLHAFYDILVCIKLILCSGAMAYYIERRFKGSLSSLAVILLSCSYGLMQYNLEQAKNVMWLDPLCVLPFLLWEGHRLIEGRGMARFSVWATVALLYNWYMGFIVLLFTGIWLTWEYVFEKAEGKLIDRNVLIFVGRLGAAICLGVGLAGFVLVPAFTIMATGRGSIDWNSLSLSYSGSRIHFIQGFQAGAISGNKKVTLFVGSYALVGALIFYLDSNFGKTRRIWILYWLPFSLLVFYWAPFYFLFSLLKSATSYWYRYSFIFSIPMIFCTASYLSMPKSNFRNDKRNFALLLIYPAITILLSVVRPGQSQYFVFLSSFIFVVLLGYFYLHGTEYNKKSRFFRIYKAIVFVLVLVELTFNAGHVMNTFKNNDVLAYRAYVQDGVQQVQHIKENDKEIYRLHQTHPFYTQALNITANFNEPLAYGYYGISSYTSSPDNRGLAFLNRMGYAQCGENMNITTGSILSADSLLGVKYILSPVQLEGLKEVSWGRMLNDERIYQNPYMMPLAFTLKSSAVAKVPYHNDPFVYQNLLWSELLGHPVSIYKRMEYQISSSNEHTIIFALKTPADGSCLLYGNLPTSGNLEGELLINHQIRQGYSRWLAPSVFNIPQNAFPTVELHTKQKNNQVIANAQFYYLDLKEWENIYKEVENNAAQIHAFKNGKVEMDVSGQQGKLLFTSVPYDKGWQIKVNGNRVSPKLIENYLMAIPLADGDNHVVLTYQLPGFKKGILVTLLSILILIGVSPRHTHLFNS